jgi:hypothetical protein
VVTALASYARISLVQIWVLGPVIVTDGSRGVSQPLQTNARIAVVPGISPLGFRTSSHLHTYKIPKYICLAVCLLKAGRSIRSSPGVLVVFIVNIAIYRSYNFKQGTTFKMRNYNLLI